MSGPRPEIDKLRFSSGETAEDFANKVADALRDDGGEIAVPGTVRIAFEDFTLPDHIVMLGGTEVDGIHISYTELFGGALEYFHGIRPSGYRAVQNPDVPPMQPFSMQLEIGFQDQSVEPPAA